MKPVPTSNKVLEKSELLLDFDMPLPLESGCKITVQLPSEFTEVYQQVSQIQVYGMFGFIRNLPFTVKALSIIEIRDACLSYIENHIEAKIRIKSVINPNAVRDTESFRIEVHDSSGNLLAQTEGDQFFVPASEFQSAQLTELSIVPSNPIIQEKSSLSFNIQTKNKLSSEAKIIVLLPNDI